MLMVLKSGWPILNKIACETIQSHKIRLPSLSGLVASPTLIVQRGEQCPQALPFNSPSGTDALVDTKRHDPYASVGDRPLKQTLLLLPLPTKSISHLRSCTNKEGAR